MLKFLSIVFAAVTLTACGCSGPGAEKSTKKTFLVGSYTQQRPLDEEQKALFRQVTAELDGVGYTPESVATQVVAGVNYRFICKAETATREPQTYPVEIIVYKPLPGQGGATITSIRKL